MQRIQLGVPPAEFFTNPTDILRAFDSMAAGGIVAMDTETSGLDIVVDEPLYVGIATLDRRIAFSVDSQDPDIEGRARRISAFQQALDKYPNTVVAMHNAKFDMHMLKNAGVVLPGTVHDIRVMAGMSDSSRSSLELKQLAVIVYGANDLESIRYLDFVENFGRPGKRGKVHVTAADLLRAAPVDKISDYVTADSWTTFKLHRTLESQLREIRTWKGQTLWDLFNTYEVPFTRLLWDCELTGMRVDAHALSHLKTEWEKEIETLEKEFCTLAGRVINLRSTDQVRKYFLLEKGLKVVKYSAGGESGEVKASTSKDALAVWANQGVREAQILTRFREVDQLLKNFVRPLIRKAGYDKRSRVHTNLNQVGAETGRLSSSDPNLQNIPVRTDDGRKIREAFIAEEGNCLVVRDYEQLEMKITAGLSGDRAMLQIIHEGKDIHAGNASIAFNVPYEEIMEAVRLKEEIEEAHAKGLETNAKLTPEQKKLVGYRKDAKAIGFGTLYGEGAKKLSIQLGCTIEEAKAKRKLFFSKFTAVQDLIQKTHLRVQRELQVQTLMGRVRALPAAGMRDGPAFWKALRQSFNTEIQGTAADIAKLAMLRIWRDERIRELGGHLLNQVHDELIVECPISAADEINDRMEMHMRDCVKDLGVALPLEFTSSGRPCPNWAAGK